MIDYALKSEASPYSLLEALGNTPDGVYAVDEQHRIILWNNGACRILGYTSDEVVGKLCYEILRGFDAEGRPVCIGGCSDITLARAGLLVPSRDVVARTKDGKDLWLNVINIAIPSSCKGLSALVHIFREVTARKHMEQLVERLLSLIEPFAAFHAGQAQGTAGAPVPEPSPPLTPREHQVLNLLAQGAGPAAIARALVISQATSRKHIFNILKRLKVHTALEAVVYASNHGLLSGPGSNKQPIP